MDWVEKDGANVVQVTVERKETAPLLVVPHFDLVVVSTRYKNRLGWMKGDTAYGACWGWLACARA
jgi:hypothetical protein